MIVVPVNVKHVQNKILRGTLWLNFFNRKEKAVRSLHLGRSKTKFLNRLATKSLGVCPGVLILKERKITSSNSASPVAVQKAVHNIACL